MSEIFREIDEELRRDNLLKLWARYGRYIVVTVLLACAAAGGFVLWRDHQLSQRREQATRYAAALEVARQGKDADAARLFARIAEEGGGYGRLALFEQAELLAKSGDAKGAVAIYDRIAASAELEPMMRDVAVLLAVIHGAGEGDANAIAARLAPLTAVGHPFRPTAIELTALARLKAGDRGAALEAYKKLADDLDAPPGLRARAAEMVAALAS